MRQAYHGREMWTVWYIFSEIQDFFFNFFFFILQKKGQLTFSLSHLTLDRKQFLMSW